MACEWIIIGGIGFGYAVFFLLLLCSFHNLFFLVSFFCLAHVAKSSLGFIRSNALDTFRRLSYRQLIKVRSVTDMGRISAWDIVLLFDATFH